jgi:hypothetical protein
MEDRDDEDASPGGTLAGLSLLSGLALAGAAACLTGPLAVACGVAGALALCLPIALAFGPDLDEPSPPSLPGDDAFQEMPIEEPGIEQGVGRRFQERVAGERCRAARPLRR